MDTVPAELSIITPVFNGERYLAEVIESIVAQQDIEIEYIIVNDGSTDSSLAIANKFQQSYPKMIRVFDQKNSGEASAVNFGFLQAESEFVCIVNADDPLLPSHCRTMVDCSKENNSVVSYPDWVMIDEDGSPIRHVKTIDYSQRALVADFVCIPGPGAVIRRDCLTDFPPRDPRYRYVSDFVCWLRLSQYGVFTRVPIDLATWRQHASGATAIARGKPIGDELIRLGDRGVIEIFQNQISAKWRRHARAHAMYYAGLMAIDDRSVSGRRLIAKSFLLKPLPNFGYQTHHRSLLAVVAVYLGPIGRRIVIKLKKTKKKKTNQVE